MVASLFKQTGVIQPVKEQHGVKAEARGVVSSIMWETEGHARLPKGCVYF